MNKLVTSLTIAITSLMALPAAAQVAGPCGPTESCLPLPLPEASIDPRFEMLKNALESRGGNHPIFGPDRNGDIRTDGVDATLRFSRVLSHDEIVGLRAAGIEWSARSDGSVVRVGTVYGAFVPWSALERLDEFPLVRAEVAWRPDVVRPVDDTGIVIGSTQAHPLPDLGVTGAGRVIVDVDTLADVLHPHLFRADGGTYSWKDVDDNGIFTPGVDAVDIDGDGEFSSNETLEVLDGALIGRNGPEGADNLLDPRRDWLYIDVNENGERDVGIEAGFNEDDPAYGEPLFVADDADDDLALEVGEPLVRLSTSKIRRLYTPRGEYIRGTNLIESAADLAIRYSGHGSAVSSVLVGGQRGYHDLVGIAPGADLIVFDAYSDESGETDQDITALRALDTALSQGADAVIHEWTSPFTAQHDGSTNLNAAMDSARAEGVVQVTPLGNLNLSGKHIERAFQPGVPLDLEFVVPADGFSSGGTVYPYRVAYLSIYWRGESNPSFVLIGPNDTSIEIVADGSTRRFDNNRTYYTAVVDQSSRGTSQLYVVLFTDGNSGLESSDWTLRAQDTTSNDLVWGRITDDYSSWGRGIHWKEPTRDSGTIVYPATADSSFGVAAFAGRNPGTVGFGSLRDYSSRGPRIDGERGVDIAAPDDPIAAFPGIPEYVEAGYGRSWFRTFGGTSGAGPHVAGAVALLREQNPEMSAEEIERRITDSARTEGLLPAPLESLPDTNWGYGKLDVFAALYGSSAPDNFAPRATLEQVGNRLDASSSNDPDGDPLEFRFDVDVDGTYERDWSDLPEYDGELIDGAYARVDVRDTAGAQHSAIVLLDVEEDAPNGSEADAGQPDSGDEVVVVGANSSSGGGCSATGSNSAFGHFIALAALIGAAFVRRRRRGPTTGRR